MRPLETPKGGRRWWKKHSPEPGGPGSRCGFVCVTPEHTCTFWLRVPDGKVYPPSDTERFCSWSHRQLSRQGDTLGPRCDCSFPVRRGLASVLQCLRPLSVGPLVQCPSAVTQTHYMQGVYMGPSGCPHGPLGIQHKYADACAACYAVSDKVSCLWPRGLVTSASIYERATS